VAGAIRSFFLQPFKIPTNSMWPTYNGMTAEVRSITDGEPAFPLAGYNSRLAPQFFPGGDVRRLVRADVDGEVFIPLRSLNQGGYGEALDNGIWGTRLFRSMVQEGRIFVRDRDGKVHVHSFTVPLEFDLTDVWQKTYFPESSRILKPAHYYSKRGYQRSISKAQSEGRIQDIAGESCITPETVTRIKKGELLLNFDVLTGDMLFVDRMSYNFVDPSRGDTFVFRTNNIPGLNSRSDGQPSQSYYVKRLAGVPGQKLRVGENGELFVDSQVVTSPEPMVLNSRRAMDQGYYGYLPDAQGYYSRYEISLQREFTVSPNHFFALGDNSANSMDSRGWGEVPAKDVVGKPLFILHPFTSHWGPAK
jgi:signal peptidase I